MRWKNKPEPKDGDIRTRRTFLLAPRRFGNDSRWLEMATIREERISYHRQFGAGGMVFPENHLFHKWVEVGFEDGEP